TSISVGNVGVVDPAATAKPAVTAPLIVPATITLLSPTRRSLPASPTNVSRAAFTLSVPINWSNSTMASLCATGLIVLATAVGSALSATNSGPTTAATTAT